MSFPRNRPLTKKEIRSQMDLLNDPVERKIANDVLARPEDKDMRPPCRSSLAALRAKEKEEQLANDKTIAKLVASDVAKGLPPESNASTREDATNAREVKVNHVSHGNNLIKSNVLRVKQGPTAALEKLHPQVTESVLSSFLNNEDLGRLSTSYSALYTQTNKIRKKRAFVQYLQAIIFNDPSIISSILHSYPDFLLAKPEDYGIKEIECQHTWLRYLPESESVFSIAQQLGHIDVVNAMLEYAKKESRITELEDAWIMKMPTEAEQKALQDKYIQDLILPMISALATDTTITVQANWEKNSEKTFCVTKIDNANVVTLEARKALREELFRPKAMRDCIDAVQFLIATQKAFITYFNTFQNYTQRNAFAVWVIGLAQSLVGRDLAMKLCQSLTQVVRDQEPIGVAAASLKLSDGRSFYRMNRDDAGLGSSFLCCVFYGYGKYMIGVETGGLDALENYVKQNQQSVERMRQLSNDACVTSKSNRGM